MPRTPTRRTMIGGALMLALLVAMGLNTTFITPEELAAAGPQEFDPEQTAAELFEQANAELPGQAVPLGEVVTALQEDTAGAAEQFDAVEPSGGSYVFTVTATGEVLEATADTLRIRVDGVPRETDILVPISTSINGTILRDALGFRFADAPGQSDFQFVGDELKKLMQAQIGSAVEDPQSLEGQQVTVVGALGVLDTGGPQPPAKPVSVQPISVEASP